MRCFSGRQQDREFDSHRVVGNFGNSEVGEASRRDGKKRSRNRVSDLEDEVAENRRREAEEVRCTLVDPIKKYQ